MKPVYLEFCGINSFSEKAQIDFNALLSGGVFGIFGDTGSGKSTILDSIHFALYGEIDRAPKSFNDCINTASDGAYVTFDFQLTKDGERKTYRVRRERKRKNGTTKAYLYEKTPDDEWLALAEGARDVDEYVEKIVGLTFADFKTCIALPQGDFAALVKSTPAERVKLVARLFNLEKYGERLAKSVNEKYYRAEEEVRLVKAKMEENEGGDEQTIAQLQSQIKERKNALSALQKQAEEAEENYRIALEFQKQKRAFDELCVRLKDCQVQMEDMQRLRDELSRLTGAKQVVDKFNALQNNEREKRLATEKSAQAKSQRENAILRLETAKKALNDANFDEGILQTSLALEKLNAAAQDIEAEQRAKAQLDACILDYKKLESACVQEDFDKKLGEIEKELQTLGEDDNLLDYLKRNLKGVLLVQTHKEICEDLKTLAEKYPQIQQDVEVLLKKYALQPSSVSAQTDVASLQLAFKEIERKRKALKIEQENIEKRRRTFEENESKKKLLIEQGKLLRQHYDLAAQKTANLKTLGSAQSLNARLNELKEKQRGAQNLVESLQEKVAAYYADWQKQEGLAQLYASKEEELFHDLKNALQTGGFQTADEAIALVQKLGDGEKARQKTDTFFQEYNVLLRQYADADKEKYQTFDEEAMGRALANKTQQNLLLSECLQQLGGEENKLKRLLELREKYKELSKELAEKEKYKNLCEELKTLLKSNRFLEFIASEYLQEICFSASKTLLSLTGGKYFLQYDKEFKVGDNLNGGNLRAVKTLSGGETFLVSLSLALSLSAAICLKSLRPIEFFFLDEGFGTLDEKLVDTVMDVLGKLSKSFAVGLISHVEELKHRIDNKILVTGANERHGSKVQVECY